MNRLMGTCCAIAMAAVLGSTAMARADVTISTHATIHMRCVSGVCTPTGAKAVLNVSELNAMLGSGAVTIESSAAAPDIYVEAGISWANTNMLNLYAYRSLHIDRAIDATAGGCLWVYTNDGGGSDGVFTFGKAGLVHFLDPVTSTLQINGIDYTVVTDVASLASGITSNPGGSFALAASYDAGPDGSYEFAPVNTTFTGNFEGLGNTISNLSVRHGNRKLGLFNTVGAGGHIENISLTRMRLHATGNTKSIGGGIAAVNDGTIFNAHTSGKISTTGIGGTGGALVGINNGTITASSSNATPQIGSSCVGGLVGLNTGTISQSYAAGRVAGRQPGGLACENSGTIVDSYDVANVLGRSATPYPGGLTSVNDASGVLTTSYAAGQITAVSNFGGIAGTNNGALSQVYWDIDDTGAGAGFGCGAGSCSGATALSRTQLQSALPSGFDPAIWGRSGINNGLPYLLNNPPR